MPEWTPARRTEDAAVTREGIARRRVGRARDAELSAWFVRTLESRPDHRQPLVVDLFAEARKRLEEHMVDLGGESELSAKERSLLEYEQGQWIVSQLSLYVAVSNPTGESAAEMFAKATSASRAGAGILKDLGLRRRERRVPDLASYLARKAAQVDAGEANSNTSVPEVEVEGDRGSDGEGEFSRHGREKEVAP